MITPKKDGFRSCGEHERHTGTIIIFPERKDIWRDNAIHAQKLCIELANTIVNYEDVFLCVKPHLRKRVSRSLDSKIRIIEIEYDDIWARDISPNFVVKNNEMRAVCWNFNSWGGFDEGAYFPWDKDAAFAKRIADYLGVKKYIINDVVLEGGSVITDGNGILYTTKNVLLNKNRNPRMTIEQVETYLREFFCADTIIWLEEGLALDETDGHIDNVCSIVHPGEMCIAWTDDDSDPQYEVSKRAMGTLYSSNTVQTLHKIPIPAPQFITAIEAAGIEQLSTSTNRVEGFQLVPSYINYYLCNSAVIFPIFNCEHDDEAIKAIKSIFNEREIIPFYAREPLIGGGGFHCILHEIPSAI